MISHDPACAPPLSHPQAHLPHLGICIPCPAPLSSQSIRSHNGIQASIVNYQPQTCKFTKGRLVVRKSFVRGGGGGFVTRAKVITEDMSNRTSAAIAAISKSMPPGGKNSTTLNLGGPATHNAQRSCLNTASQRRFATHCGKLRKAPKRTRNDGSQRTTQKRGCDNATQKRGCDNAGCHNASRVVATQPPQRNPQRGNHARHSSATAFGNSEPQRHGGKTGLRQRGLQAGCNNARLPQRAMRVATTRLRNS